MTEKQRDAALKAFRDLWVAGTVGGFLAALMRSVPPDLRAIAHAPSDLFIYDLVLRYLYILWFIVYFLLSNLNKDTVSGLEVVFDMIQTLSSFAAAWALGIAVRGEGYQFPESGDAFAWATGAIVIICAVSLAFFSQEKQWNKWKQIPELTRLRLVGAVAGIFGLLVSLDDPQTVWHLVLLTAILGVLAWLLWRFGLLRISEL